MNRPRNINDGFIDAMNRYGEQSVPFLFVIDFDMKEPLVAPLSAIDPGQILYSIGGMQNFAPEHAPEREFSFRKIPVPYDRYLKAFNFVQENQRMGNSYLLNLTFPTRLETDLSLREIFHMAGARYKLFMDGRVVVFSPETFVTVEDGLIASFPMKGTIDAAVPDAERVLLEDEKEYAEHVTIVDLIRNDLNMVAEEVAVDRFRYVETIRTRGKDILQTSSRVTGKLGAGYRGRLGSIIAAILPAGSVTGAPKKMTVELIKEAEGYDRGYYTGVFGLYDGRRLDSAVMIRYVEMTGGDLWYKSGGGITVYSDPVSEYNEMVDKVYVPAG